MQAQARQAVSGCAVAVCVCVCGRARACVRACVCVCVCMCADLQGQEPVLDGEFWAPNKRLQKAPKVKPDAKMEIVDGCCVVTLT
jgi:hypothetical protein